MFGFLKYLGYISHSELLWQLTNGNRLVQARQAADVNQDVHTVGRASNDESISILAPGSLWLQSNKNNRYVNL